MPVQNKLSLKLNKNSKYSTEASDLHGLVDLERKITGGNFSYMATLTCRGDESEGGYKLARVFTNFSKRTGFRTSPIIFFLD